MRFEFLSPFFRTEMQKTVRPEFSEFVDVFDFTKFSELVRQRVGAEKKERVAIVQPEKIIDSQSADESGNYIAEDKTIRLGLEAINKRAEALGLDAQMLKEQVLIHEQLHAAFDTNCRESSMLTRDFVVGFSRATKVKGTNIAINGLFPAWNEGVTEKMSREIFAQYSERPKEQVDDFLEILQEQSENQNVAYSPEVKLVEAFVGRLSQSTGKDFAEVWGMIQEAFITGEGFDQPRLNEMANEVLPKNFLNDLAQARARLTVRRLTKELESADKIFLHQNLFVQLRAWLKDALNPWRVLKAEPNLDLKRKPRQSFERRGVEVFMTSGRCYGAATSSCEACWGVVVVGEKRCLILNGILQSRTSTVGAAPHLVHESFSAGKNMSQTGHFFINTLQIQI